MREFREAHDSEEKLRVSERKRMTFEDAREYVKKFDKSLEESKVEKEEVNSEFELEKVKSDIKEYGGTEEDFEKVMDEITGEVSINTEPIEEIRRQSIISERRKIDPEEVRKLYFDDKMKQKEVAEFLGTSERTISRIFKEQGWEGRTHKFDIDPEEIHRLYFEEGFSLKRITEHFGYKSVSSVCRIFEKHGWEPRPPASIPKEIDIEEVRRLYFEEHFTQGEIGKHFGFKSSISIRRVFEKEGWELQPRNRIKDLDVDEIHRLHFDEGYSQVEIAELMGLKSTFGITKVFKENDWKSRTQTKQEREIDPEEVYKLYFEDGLSQREIAKHYSFKSVSRIRKIFEEQSWKSRAQTKQEREIDPEEVYKLHFEDGLSQREIAKHYSLESSFRIRSIFEEQSWKAITKFDIDYQEVWRLYFEEGLTQREVAKKLGLQSQGSIIRVFKEQGWTPRQRLNGEHINPEEVHRLYFEIGLTVKEISEHFGFNTTYSIKQMFKENGWEKRTRIPNEISVDSQEVHRLYFDEGHTQKEVMQLLGISLNEFQRIFAREGWRARHNTQPLLSEEERNLANKERNRRHRLKVAERREQLWGIECHICGPERIQNGEHGETNIIQIHRKDGSSHPRLHSLKTLREINPDEYIPLCIPCHRATHFLMSKHSLIWDEVDALKDKDKIVEELQIDDGLETNIQLSSLDETYDNQELREIIFGKDCYYCGPEYEDRKLVIHRKDGTSHEPQSLWSREFLVNVNPSEWIAVCQKCHLDIHSVMERFGLKEEFLFPK